MWKIFHLVFREVHAYINWHISQSFTFRNHTSHWMSDPCIWEVDICMNNNFKQTYRKNSAVGETHTMMMKRVVWCSPFSTSKQKVWLGAAISLLNMITLIPAYCRPSGGRYYRYMQRTILLFLLLEGAIFLWIYTTTKKYELWVFSPAFIYSYYCYLI